MLKHIKGFKYPIQDATALKERLKGVKIKNCSAEEVLNKIYYPVKTSAQLLHEIKLAISGMNG